METETQNERHVFRFLVKFLVFAGVVYFAGRLAAQQKKNWEGLTESQARSRIEPRLASKLGDEKATDIADQIITALKDRGIIKEDEVEIDLGVELDEAVEVVKDTAGDAAEAVAEAVETAKKK
jgi:hypothetical protein